MWDDVTSSAALGRSPATTHKAVRAIQEARGWPDGNAKDVPLAILLGSSLSESLCPSITLPLCHSATSYQLGW
ncbi:hypothetical protein V491_07609 [Pseudogymnoascus sp. VKM F-3775]|nr:hypothetical protein V491_07609 [Pseudogymnoascus sp. VKM F-3775]